MAANPYSAYKKVATAGTQAGAEKSVARPITQNPESRTPNLPQRGLASNQYRQNEVLTATPEHLIAMLYDGAIRFMKKGMAYIDEQAFAEANTALLRAQDIVQALMSGLDMDYELSTNLYSLYDFLNTTLVEANIHKDADRVQQAVTLIEDLRDTWAQAMVFAKKANKPETSKV